MARLVLKHRRRLGLGPLAAWCLSGDLADRTLEQMLVGWRNQLLALGQPKNSYQPYRGTTVTEQRTPLAWLSRASAVSNSQSSNSARAT